MSINPDTIFEANKGMMFVVKYLDEATVESRFVAMVTDITIASGHGSTEEEAIKDCHRVIDENLKEHGTLEKPEYTIVREHQPIDLLEHFRPWGKTPMELADDVKQEFEKEKTE